MNFSAVSTPGGDYNVVFTPIQVTLNQFGGGIVNVSVTGTQALPGGYLNESAIEATLAANGQKVDTALQVKVEQATEVRLDPDSTQISETGSAI